MADKNICKKYAVCDAERPILLYLFWESELKEDNPMLGNHGIRA